MSDDQPLDIQFAQALAQVNNSKIEIEHAQRRLSTETEYREMAVAASRHAILAEKLSRLAYALWVVSRGGIK